MVLSPHPFEAPESLLAQARAHGSQRVAVAGATNAVTLESARRAYEAGLLTPILVGDPDAIEAQARELGWALEGIEIAPGGDEQANAAAAVALARSGEAAAIMKGTVHTDVLLRAVLNKEIGLRTGQRLSHVFHMTVPGREGALLITDAAINVAPSVDLRMDILGNALGVTAALGYARPRVAVLSATETASAAVPSSEEAVEIVRRARELDLEAEVDGPMALDLAISPSAAEIKGAGGAVFGTADLILVPTIETGNALFKAMVYFASATAAGLVLGARVPIMLTSRADPPEARLASAALAAIKAGAAA